MIGMRPLSRGWIVSDHRRIPRYPSPDKLAICITLFVCQWNLFYLASADERGLGGETRWMSGGQASLRMPVPEERVARSCLALLSFALAKLFSVVSVSSWWLVQCQPI